MSSVGHCPFFYSSFKSEIIFDSFINKSTFIVVVLPFQDPQTERMDEWELKFEHIDWIDISDAELSGNQEALEKLMYEKIYA